MHETDQEGWWVRFREGLRWRLGNARRWTTRSLGIREQHWCRVVMDRETARLVSELNVSNMDCLEISGTKWQSTGFRTYRSADYPEYDVCERPFAHEAFDLVIAEQVLEHVLWPFRAVKHVHECLRPGGAFLVTTPFLLRIHNYPVDCTRWTEIGLKYLLAEGGFEVETLRTGSWGNRACVKANFDRWANWVPWLHSLSNEPDYPVVVWALARKSK